MFWDIFDDYGYGRSRYANRAEKSSAAKRREDQATSKFDYLRGQVELANYENTMTLIGLACRDNESPLSSLSSDVMEHVMGYADIKPRGSIVKDAVEGRKEMVRQAMFEGGPYPAIIPLEGWRGQRAPEDAAHINMANLSFFQPGSKVVFPLTKPNLHLTGPCYRDFRKHVARYAQWDVKRTKATPQQKKQYKETRQGHVYFINAVYTVPGKPMRKKAAGGKRKRGGEGTTAAANQTEKLTGGASKKAKKLAVQKPATANAKPLPGHSSATKGTPNVSYVSSQQQGGIFTIVINKARKDTKLGIGIGQQKGTTNTIVTSIRSDSIFTGTDLRVGMVFVTVNGKSYSSFDQCLRLLKDAVGSVVIVAGFPAATKAA